MNKSRLLGAVCVLCITVLALYSKSINADLIEVDLLTSNDAFITRDTDTGLDWLDVTLTRDHSVNEVLGGCPRTHL